MDNQEKKFEPIGDLKYSFGKFFGDIKKFIVHIFNFQDDVDKVGAAENIKKEVEFQGFNVWILISSIAICSIGLNMNSTAVIIGAMLISPLMGPITGIGFAVGTFDRDLWIKSLKNLFNAVIVSVITSFLYFSIAPEGANSSELLARTSPTMLDVLVALFGGLAGILASTRSIKTNVIPGVAIATALMPPLCTVGYGLATAQYNYSLGALYLFFINSVFISVAALVVVRYLKFPTVTYVNSKVQNRVRVVLILSVIVVSVPSIFFYQKAMKKSQYQSKVNKFIQNEVAVNDRWIAEPVLNGNDSVTHLRLFVYGDEISDSMQKVLSYRMNEKYSIPNTVLHIENMGYIGKVRSKMERVEVAVVDQERFMADLKNEVVSRSVQVDELKDSIAKLNTPPIDIHELNAECKVLYPCVSEVAYGDIHSEVDSMDQSMLTLFIHWNKNCSSSKRRKEFKTLEEWLNVKYKTKFPSLNIVEVKE